MEFKALFHFGTFHFNLMPFAFTFPLLNIQLLGVPVYTSIWSGVWKMATEGYPYSAFFSAILRNCHAGFLYCFDFTVATLPSFSPTRKNVVDVTQLYPLLGNA